jgi:signal transduction histidine kinase
MTDSRARLPAADDEERRRVVRDLHDGAQQRLVHTVITLKLAAAELQEGGLQAGARVLAARMTVPVEVNVSTGRLPEPIEATAYFLMAEALTNVTKHARARQAAVMARVDDRALRIEVRDDGVGGALAHGSGLIGLRDRVTALKGTFGVDSRPGCGTVVTATIPVGRP